MTSCLEVQAPGLSTTLQDFGRPGHQALGIPVSGALDTDSLRIANRLVGNQEGEAALEIRLLGPTLRVDAESVRVALAGTTSPLEIVSPTPRHIPPWQSIRLGKGDVFRVGTLRDSSTAYLALAGGLDVPEVLGSRSTYGRGGFGGFNGRNLATGDRLPLRGGPMAETVDLHLSGRFPLARPGRIRVVLGPQQDYFSADGLEAFLTGPFTVTNEADRMGLRLAGPILEHAKGFNIVSDGIATGAIQVPGNGHPIVLLSDHQTTGGYPKIATVMSADLPALGRAQPGEKVYFEAVAVEAAEQAREEHERFMSTLMGTIEPVSIDPMTLSSATLLSMNLVSGFIDAIDQSRS